MKLEKLEWSAVWTVLGVVALFSTAIAITLITPSFIDPSWKEPSSAYQAQMYEVSDPNVYVRAADPASFALQYVYHLKEGYTLLSFQESSFTRILAPSELEKYVTHFGESEVKLTSKLLFLRQPKDSVLAGEMQKRLQEAWAGDNLPHYEI